MKKALLQPFGQGFGYGLLRLLGMVAGVGFLAMMPVWAEKAGVDAPTSPQAVESSKQQQYEAKIAALTQTLQRNPKDVEALYHRAIAQHTLQDGWVLIHSFSEQFLQKGWRKRVLMAL
ncbi:MAG: hypothetical protein WCD18_01685 [Thermosynechococcaceae cyanobacterium]